MSSLTQLYQFCEFVTLLFWVLCVSQIPLPNLPHLEFRINPHSKSSYICSLFLAMTRGFFSLQVSKFWSKFLQSLMFDTILPLFWPLFPLCPSLWILHKASPLWAASQGSAQLCAQYMPGNLKAAVTRCDRTWLPWFLLLKNVQSQVCGGATDTVIGFTEFTDVNPSWLCGLQPCLDCGCVCIYSGAGWS